MANSLPDFTKIAQPFANSGDRNTIPQTATGTNNASFQEGFPSITSAPLADGGMPPERADFNALGYAATSTLAYLQQGGVFTFDETISSIIGGYPQGAILDYIADNKAYKLISLINNNTYNFNTDATYIGQYWSYVYTDVDLSNITQAGKTLAAGLAMPSSRYDELTIGAHNTSYFAPANGYFSFYVNNLPQDKTIGLHNLTTGMHIKVMQSSSNAQWMGCFMPAKTGDEVIIKYNDLGETSSFTFVYAVGEEN